MAKSFAIGYLIVSLLLVAAWAAPELPFGQQVLDVRIVLDRSASMLRVNQVQLTAAITEALDSLPPNTHVELVEFDETAEVVIPPAQLSDTTKTALRETLTRERSSPSLASHISNIEKGIRSALHPSTGQHQPAILLITDGIETQGDAGAALNSAAISNTPVFYLPLARETGADAWVSDLRHPTVARVGDQILVSATATSTVDAPAVIKLFVADKQVSTEPVQLRTGEGIEVSLPYIPENAGPAKLGITISLPNDTITDNDSIESTLDVLGSPNVLYISQKPIGYLAQSLHTGNFQFRHTNPETSQAQVATATANTVIVLDDVAADDLPASAVAELTTAVGERGAGLMVLGGPHAFGAGAYRHSRLETLLPVTSESGLPQPKAAVLFVVDKSGSMESDPNESSRLALAQRAVTETAKTLGPDDLVGLLAFDVTPHWLLPLAASGDPAGAVANAAAAMRANGGTHLRPALEQAIEALGATTAEPRLLVLVTDGFSENDKINDLAKTLAEKKIVLIALAVGADAETGPLQSVAAASGGSVVKIVDILRLPRLMRQEVDLRRQPSEIGRIQPQLASSIPFFAENPTWPPLDGYNVTKARPAATLYLRSPRGDPLMAAHYFGAGHVIALPGGLNSWAGAWPAWSHWPRFSGNLAQWAAGSTDDAHFHLKLHDQADSIEINVDATDARHVWLNTTNGQAHVTGPDGRRQETTLKTVAPGRFATQVSATLPGTYTVSAQTGPYHSVRHITHQTPLELANPAVGADNLRRWEQQNLLEPWSAQRLRERTPSTEISTRPLFLISAGLVYLLLIAGQRGWLSRRASRRPTNP